MAPVPKLFLLLMLLAVFFLAMPEASAQVEGRPTGWGWCSTCGGDRGPSHDFTHGGGSSYGGGGGGEPITVESIKGTPMLNRAITCFIGVPIFLGIGFPLNLLHGLLTGNFDKMILCLEVSFWWLEPYWILPYHMAKWGGIGLYHMGKWGWVGLSATAGGIGSYVSMDLVEFDEYEYEGEVSSLHDEAVERQSASQADFVRWEPESEESRQQRVAERIAKIRGQAAQEAQHSQLRRIYRGIRETQEKLDAPEARVRQLGPKLDPVSDEAIRQVRSGELRDSRRDDLLFGAFDKLTSAFGPVGEVVQHAGHAMVGAIDTQRELAVLESSRLEGRAARLRSLQQTLGSLRDLPPEEKKKAIQKCLSEAAPLLTRARAEEGLTGWRFLGKARSRRANWEIEAPVLRKRIQKYGAGMVLGKLMPEGADEVSLETGADGLRFFREGVEATVKSKATGLGLDWVDQAVDRVQGGGR